MKNTENEMKMKNIKENRVKLLNEEKQMINRI